MRSTISARSRRSRPSTHRREAAPAESIAARNVVDGLKLYEMHRPMRAANPDARIAFPPLFVRCRDALELLADAVDAVSDAVTAETRASGRARQHRAHRGDVAGDRERRSAAARARSRAHAAYRSRGHASRGRAVQRRDGAGSRNRRAQRRSRSSTPGRRGCWARSQNMRFARRAARCDRRAPCRRSICASTSFGSSRSMSCISRRCAPASRCRSSSSDCCARHAGGSTRACAGEAAARSRRGADWLPNEIGLDELAELAARARQLFAGARALDARDLTALQSSNESGIDAAEFEARAKAAQQCARCGTRAVTCAARRGRYARCCGLVGAHRCLGRLRHRRRAFDAIESGDALHCPGARGCSRSAAARRACAARGDAARMLRAIFGAGFLALPRFTLADATELPQSLAATNDLQGGDPLAVYPWFQQVQRVREPVSRLGASLHAAEAHGAGRTACTSTSRSCRTWPASAGSDFRPTPAKRCRPAGSRSSCRRMRRSAWRSRSPDC